MGDVSAEPSMEDILSSIKRIIADENEGAARARRQSARPIPSEAPRQPTDEPVSEEVLELREAIASAVPDAAPGTQSAQSRQPVSHAFTAAAQTAAASAAHAAAVTGTPIAAPAAVESAAQRVSRETVEATRGALDTLSRMVVKPEAGGDNTLEGLVREMLRPMLSAWLDQNLPVIVEQAVAREIAKITAEQG